MILVGGSSRIPKVQQLLQDFFEGKDLCSSINPDEAVAYGAAVQAALLCDGIKNVPNLVLQDVTPLSLGTSVVKDIMYVVIPKNTSFPIKRKRTFCTLADDQSAVKIDVYEGERMVVGENNLLGLFDLKVRCAPRGLNIQVCFDIDADGTLNVSAEEETSGNKKEITVTNENGRLSREEIEKKIKEAEYFKSEDMKFIEKVRAVNALDDYIYRMRKVMKDDSITSKLTPVEKVEINSAIIKGENLIDDKQQYETFVFADFLRELESTCESALKRINIDSSEK